MFYVKYLLKVKNEDIHKTFCMKFDIVLLIKVQKAVLFYVHYLWRSRDFLKGCLAAIFDCFHGNRCRKQHTIIFFKLTM